MMQAALKIVSEIDASAAIAFLEAQDDAVVAARTFEELARHFYWQEKNIANMVLISRGGIQFSFTQAANGTTNPEKAYQLRSIAKAIAYNLASFTWIGWDETDIPLGATDIGIGLDAARTNLRLGQELNKPNLALSRAHWMVGAQLLAVREFSAAQQHFSQAVAFAEKAEETPDTLLCQGFVYLSALLADDSEENRGKLTAVKSELAPLEHGADFVAQIETAERVFTSPSS